MDAMHHHELVCISNMFCVPSIADNDDWICYDLGNNEAKRATVWETDDL